MTFAQDYVEVADRIREWYERHPSGAILTELVEFSDTRAVVKAYVYRDSQDQTGAAGVGHSYLSVPGSTPFTRGSELENAETSAVGRALVMAGIPSKNVASGNEVRAKQAAGAGTIDARTSEPLSKPAPASKSAAAKPQRKGASEEKEPAAQQGAADTSEGGGADPAREAASSPSSDPTPDIVELFQKAVDKKGSTPKVVRYVHDNLDDTVRSEADILPWHLMSLIDREEGKA